MRIIVNDKQAIIPSSLSEITIGQHIAFREQYGRDLDQMAKRIDGMEEGVLKDAAAIEYRTECMIMTFAFFAGIIPETLRDSHFLGKADSIYRAAISVLLEETQNPELRNQFAWKDELWEIQPPHAKDPGNYKIKFKEFTDAKQVIKNMAELGAGDWEAMQRLCAIYLRKKDEAYTEELSSEGSDRMKLMLDLPLDIAFQVGLYLITTLNAFSQDPNEQKT